jgi:hypothetical protein
MTQFSKWKTIGYATAIFVAGGISGGALGVYETKSHLFAPPRQQDMALRIRNRLRARLDLTPGQVAKIDPIVESAATELHAIRVETAQRINKIFDDSYAQVSSNLTPDQRAKFEEMQQERREMMHRWRPGPDGPDDWGGPRHNRPPGDNAGPGPSQP